MDKINQHVFGKMKAHGQENPMVADEDFTANIDAAMAAMAMAVFETLNAIDNTADSQNM